MKYLLFLLFLCLLSTCDQGIRIDSVEASKITAYLEQLSQQGFSGNILVAKEGEILLKKGYGYANDSLQIRVTPNTIFTIGSITKQFTGAGILKLEMQGKLSLNDNINDYFENIPSDKRDITIHHLLTHSAGFRGAIGDDFDPIKAADFVKLAMDSELIFEPGSQYEYSNVGYSLLGIIIEKVSGLPYESFLHKEIFQVLGMNNTGYAIPNWGKNVFAQGYRNDRHWGTILDRPWAEDGPGWHLRANGGILSTPEDMYKWYLALQGEEILNKKAKEKYFNRHIEEGEGAGTYYGYGWAIFPTSRGTELITHNGGNGVFFADMLMYLEEDVFIFFTTNRSNRKYNDAAFVIARIIFNPEFDISKITTEEIIRKDFPTTNPGLVAKELIVVIQSDNDKQMRRFIEEKYAKNFLNIAAMEEHVAILKQLNQRIGDQSPSEIIQKENSLEMKFKLDEMNLYLIIEVDKEGHISAMDINSDG